jgi:signal transduction histidine kinase
MSLPTINRPARSWLLNWGLRQRFLVSYAVVVLGGFALIDGIKQQMVSPEATGWIDIVSRLACIAILGGINSELIVQPLKTLERTVRAFTQGDLDARVSPNVIPELHRLGLSFNHMATSLQDVELRRRELSGDLAHELLSPITAFRANLEMLAAGIIEPDPEIYQQSANEAQRLERLAKTMLTLAQIETGYLPMQFEAFDLLPLLQGLRIGLIPKPDTEVTLNWQLPTAGLPWVYGDRDRIQQILTNLITNALKYTIQGTVTVSAWTAGPYLWTAVTDTGIGISSEDLPLVFDRFWRADPAGNPETVGSGVGLAITKRLVELQSGKIEVASQLGQGSMFRFSLPLAH